MFTGIVQAVGRIENITPNTAGVRLAISWGGLPHQDVAIGDSIAVNGACMTVTSFDDRQFTVDVSAESLACTHGLDRLGRVNLETAMRLGDKVGGHLVSGHVDGVGEVLSMTPAGESTVMQVRAPAAIARYIAAKGSITVNGVSLTVNSVAGDAFSVNLIPHTLAVTTLQDLQAGSAVNLEIDLIARYMERMLSYQAAQ